ncbi:TetR/AcrR family transcriptional regulator [Pseudoflavonifractor sp. HCP28S3_F10]|uniref:TetR/AcrR family transcriptional regulator n=1 Tax=Pseudoflavonifractor sp. HCP28S3_F10 TaxID=3438947 RepID=UPI003F888AC5
MNTKNNQRYKDSEKRMQDALMKLMKNQELKDVTVMDICKEAHINRTTFYAHYEDIYDLMSKVERLIRQELFGEFQTRGIGMQNIFHHDYLIYFLRHIEKYQNFYRICLRHRVKFPLEEGFEQLWEDVVKPHCRQRGVTDERAMLYYLTFYQAGFTSLLRKWVEDGCPESPEELCPTLLDCLPRTEIL